MPTIPTRGHVVNSADIQDISHGNLGESPPMIERLHTYYHALRHYYIHKRWI